MSGLAPTEREITAGVSYLRTQADAAGYGWAVSDEQLRSWTIGVLQAAERVRASHK